MKRVSFTKCLVSVFLAVCVALFVGCGNGCDCDDDDNNGNNGGEASGGKQLFSVELSRNTLTGTYGFEVVAFNIIYPFPKFLINGIEVESDDDIDIWYFDDWYGCGFEGGEFPAGNLTYSIIWDGDTLTRTLNLPSNIYSLVKDSTETQYRYKITGGNGDEKVIWSAYKSGGYVRDTLQANREFVFPKDYRFSSCSVMHKDFKPINSNNPFATVESKKIAVCEEITLQYFNSSGDD